MTCSTSFWGYTHSGIEQELARIRQIMKAALERNPEKSAQRCQKKLNKA